MNGQIRISVKALVIGGLCVVILTFAVVRWVSLERDVDRGFESIGAYIGACQEAGVLPAPEQLKARLDALAKAQAAQAPAQDEGKK